jgi:hypothetical protein
VGLALPGLHDPAAALGSDLISWGLSIEPRPNDDKSPSRVDDSSPLKSAALLRGFFDPGSFFEALGAPAGSKAGKWPAALTMAMAPTDGKPSLVPGTYLLNEGRVVNAFPTWDQAEGKLVMYTTTRGSWAITNESDIAANKNMAITDTAGHKGAAPHTVGWGKVKDSKWSVWKDIVCSRVATSATVGGPAVLPGQVEGCDVSDDGFSSMVGLAAPPGKPGCKPGCVVGVVFDPATGVLGFALDPHSLVVAPGKGKGKGVKGCRCPAKHKADFLRLEQTAVCSGCKQVGE